MTAAQTARQAQADVVRRLRSEERAALAAAAAATPAEPQAILAMPVPDGDALRSLLGSAKLAIRRRVQAQNGGQCLDCPGSHRMYRKLAGLVIAVDLINQGQERREYQDAVRQREAADRRRADRQRSVRP